MAKKAQVPEPSYAAPLILAATIVLFLFYLIMLYPWERAAILGENETTNQSPLGPNTEMLFSSFETVEVGTSSEASLTKVDLKDVSVSYPAVPVVVDFSTVPQLSANILTSDTLLMNANNVNTTNTKELLLRLNITAVEGSPKIVVILNTTTVYTGPATPGLLDISIPSSYLKTDNPVYVKLYHTGMFWEVQKIKLESIKLYRVEYQEKVKSQSQNVPIASSNYQGNTLKIKFVPTYVNSEGPLLIKINGKQVWEGKPEVNTTSEISINLDQSNIRIGDNTIQFEAAKGGEYTLTNITMQFVAQSAPAAKKIYSFNIDKSKLFSGRPIKVGIKIEHIIKPGTLQVRIVPYETVYYFSKAQLNPGVWVYTDLDKSKLKELGNQIELSSIDGRFKISGFIIVLG